MICSSVTLKNYLCYLRTFCMEPIKYIFILAKYVKQSWYITSLKCNCHSQYINWSIIQARWNGQDRKTYSSHLHQRHFVSVLSNPQGHCGYFRTIGRLNPWLDHQPNFTLGRVSCCQCSFASLVGLLRLCHHWMSCVVCCYNQRPHN